MFLGGKSFQNSTQIERKEICWLTNFSNSSVQFSKAYNTTTLKCEVTKHIIIFCYKVTTQDILQQFSKLRHFFQFIDYNVFLWIETDCPICNFFYHEMNGSLHLPVRCLFLQLLSVFLKVSMTSRLSMRHCLLQKCREFKPITVGSLGEQNQAGVGTYLLSFDANLTDSASQSKVGGVSKFPLPEIQNHKVKSCSLVCK